MASISSHERINDRLSPRKRKKGGKGVIIGGCIAFVAVVAVVVTVTAMNGNSESADDSSKNRIVTMDNVDEVIESMEDQKLPQGQFRCMMENKKPWYFKDGKSASENAYVFNAPTNSGSVYFTLSIKDTGEEILKSPPIPLGSRLENITLDKALSAGSYDCKITYHILDENEEDTGASVNFTVKLVVEQ